MMRAIAFALAAACALMTLGPQVYAMFGRALLTAGTSAPSAHPVAISPVVASAQDSTTANSILVPAGTWVVTMSDLSPFTGTITNPVGLGLTTMSGNNLVADRNFVAGDDGGHALTVCATQGTTLCTSFNLNINPVGAVACDFGPNVASIPAAAQRAGFTRCGLNAAFDDVGGTYSNTANFMNSCGASNPAWPTGSQFFVGYFLSAAYSVPCDRTAILTDPIFGNQAFRLQYQVGDFQAALNQGATRGIAGWLEINWPTAYGTDGHILPFEYYVEYVWRSDASSLNQSSNSNTAVDFWHSATNVHQEQHVMEMDLLELFANGSQSNSFTGAAAGIPTGGFPVSGNVDGFSWFADFTQYHTMAGLVTSDGSTVTGNCWYLDGTQIGCRQINDGTLYDHFNLSIDFGGNYNNGPGPCDPQNGGPVCIVNDVNIYLKAIRYWGCPNYQTQSCTTTAGSVILGPP